MADRKRVPFSEYKEDIEKIKKITADLKEVVEHMTCTPTMKTAYENSVKNLEKKNEVYGVEKLSSISDEDKELLRKFHAGQIKIQEISPTNETIPAGKKGRKNIE